MDAPGTSTGLAAELDALFAARDRGNMEPTITALLDVERRHPDNARVLYEVGGAYDTAGHEVQAAGYYERALAAGLDGDLLRRCWLQYGSTLRNLGRVGESLAVFDAARRRFPDSVALAAFEALSLHAAGRVHAAVAELLVVLAQNISAPELDRYKPALHANADYLLALEGPAPQ